MLVSVLLAGNGYAQLPRFQDPDPQVYTQNVTIAPLSPINRGGAIPPNIYGQAVTIAGNGTSGLLNGIGTNSSFNRPSDIKMDNAGNLYVADAGNNVIRNIAPDGTVSTFAGSGVAGYLDGIGQFAKFSGPVSLTIDAANNLYVVDKGNVVIREITPLQAVSVFAGVPGVRGDTNDTFTDPSGITIDNMGICYVTDGALRKIKQAHQGYVTPFAGGGPDNGPLPINGPGVSATFGRPLGITLNPDGNFYVADNSNFVIRRINSNAIVSTAAGSPLPGSFDGYGASAGFANPQGITADKTGTMFITDGDLIRRMDVNTNVSTIAGAGNGFTDGIGKAALFNGPLGMCTDNTGNLYVADAGNNVIRKISYTGYIIFPQLPPGLVFDQRTGIISGTPTQTQQATNYTVIGYNIDGKSVYTVNIQINEASRMPQTIVFNPLPNKKQTDPDFSAGAYSTSNSGMPVTYESSDISVASIADGKIHIIGPGTVFITARQAGNPFYADAEPVTQKLVITEVPILKFPTITLNPGPITLPLDATGNYNLAYGTVGAVTGENGLPDPVIKLSKTQFGCADVGPGTVTLSAGYGPDPFDPLNAEFNYPSALTYDKTTGSIFISDPGNYRVRKIAPNGRVGTLAGSGAPGDADGKASVTEFSRDLVSIATDSHGNTYVCDAGNLKVKKITPGGDVSTFGYEALKLFTSEVAFEARSIAVDKDDNIYVADKNTIIKLSPDGSTGTLFAGSGKADNVDGMGNLASFNGITGLYFSGDGTLYVASSDLNDINAIRKVSPAGDVTTLLRKSNPLLMFTRLVVDSKGNVFVASSQTEIYEVSPAGDFSIFAGTEAGYGDGLGTAAKLYNPAGIAIDPSDNLYIADSNNHRIRKITPAGLVTTIAGNGVSYWLDNTDKTNTANKTAQVIVTSPITITTQFKPVTIAYLDACPATVPDFTKAAAKSPCTTNFTFSQSPAAGTVLTNGQTITVIITATDDLSPYDKGTATVTVTAQKLPKPVVTITPNFYSSCAGAELSYTAKAENEGANPVYTWFVNDIDQHVSIAEFKSSSLATGDKITCTVTNVDACAPVTSDPSPPSSLSADAAVTTSVKVFPAFAGPACPGTLLSFKAITMNVQADGNPIYQWQVNGHNAGFNRADFSSTSLMDGDMLTCTVTSGGKCIANPVTTSDAILITARSAGECDIVIPNTFTPNGDGVNDLWDIPILTNYPNSLISIFNRYGNLVYQSIGYSKPWDGTSKGKALPAGTYYYIVDTRTNKPLMAGWVTILR